MLASYDVETRELTIIPDMRTFDMESVMQFRSAYQKYIGSNIDRVTVDFRQVTTLNSSGVGMLINMQKIFRDRTTITLSNLGPSVKRILTICGMQKKFKFS